MLALPQTEMDESLKLVVPMMALTQTAVPEAISASKKIDERVEARKSRRETMLEKSRAIDGGGATNLQQRDAETVRQDSRLCTLCSLWTQRHDHSQCKARGMQRRHQKS